MKYEIILYWSDDDNAYIAEIPELPGCMADGPTAKEALRNVELIAAEWVETAMDLGRELPTPKGRLKYLLALLDRGDSTLRSLHW